MIIRVFLLICLLAASTRPAAGQGTPNQAPPTPPPPPAAGAPASPAPFPRSRPENQSSNIRIEVTLTDERPGAAPIKKTVSMVNNDGWNGSVRSQTNYQSPGAGPASAPFNVDASSTITADGKIYVRLTVQYDVVPPPATQPGVTAPTAEPQPVRLLGTSIRDSMALMLDNNKPLVVVQSTDPVSDRKVSVDVKATILR